MIMLTTYMISQRHTKQRNCHRNVGENWNVSIQEEAYRHATPLSHPNLGNLVRKRDEPVIVEDSYNAEASDNDGKAIGLEGNSEDRRQRMADRRLN